MQINKWQRYRLSSVFLKVVLFEKINVEIVTKALSLFASRDHHLKST